MRPAFPLVKICHCCLYGITGPSALFVTFCWSRLLFSHFQMRRSAASRAEPEPTADAKGFVNTKAVMFLFVVVQVGLFDVLKLI